MKIGCILLVLVFLSEQGGEVRQATMMTSSHDVMTEQAPTYVLNGHVGQSARRSDSNFESLPFSITFSTRKVRKFKLFEQDRFLVFELYRT